MRSFEESLERVLDPEGFYWDRPGDDQDDPSRARLIKQRLDVPRTSIADAKAQMVAVGWMLDSSPDEETDELCRLYFRKVLDVTDATKTEWLTHGLRVAHNCNGTLMTWLSVEDLEN